MDSETIHNRTLAGLSAASSQTCALEAIHGIYRAPELPIDVFGLRFPNPVGLAAGMDKRAAAVPAWEALGFGFCELGGVTAHAQDGNPKPRMFRAVDDGALINRMGFNNPGADAMAQSLEQWRASGLWPAHPVGMNLGKSKITPLEQAAEDYAHSFQALWRLVDFFVVNVSSPNTPNLRQLQDKSALEQILRRLQDINLAMSQQTGFARKPVLVKVAPDLTFEALDEMLELSKLIAGIVATNTTIARPTSKDATLKPIYAETGGLSGRPLRARSTEVIRHLYRQTKGTLPIIGVGGIFDANDAWEKIAAGATLIQLYSGLVYEGPGAVKEIVQDLRNQLEERGIGSLAEAIGCEA